MKRENFNEEMRELLKLGLVNPDVLFGKEIYSELKKENGLGFIEDIISENKIYNKIQTYFNIKDNPKTLYKLCMGIPFQKYLKCMNCGEKYYPIHSTSICCQFKMVHKQNWVFIEDNTLKGKYYIIEFKNKFYKESMYLFQTKKIPLKTLNTLFNNTIKIKKWNKKQNS